MLVLHCGWGKNLEHNFLTVGVLRLVCWNPDKQPWFCKR